MEKTIKNSIDALAALDAVRKGRPDVFQAALGIYLKHIIVEVAAASKPPSENGFSARWKLAIDTYFENIRKTVEKYAR